MQDNRPGVYAEGDNIIYRASALGHPLCQLFAARSGLDRRPFPISIQRGMDEGTALEGTILNLLYDRYNFSFAYESQFVVELNVGAWNGKTFIVRGKVDEIGSDDGTRRPIDVKALTQDQIDAPTPERYLWQQSVYTHGLNADKYYMPIFNKATWEIEDRSLVPLVPKYSREQIRDRIIEVERAFFENEMPPCPGEFGCQYWYLHEEKPKEELPEKVVAIARARIILNRRINSLTDARKILDGKIKEQLSTDLSYTLDGYTVTVYANPSRFNTKAAQKLLSEADIDWQNDPEFTIPGEGTQVRFTASKRGLDSGG